MVVGVHPSPSFSTPTRSFERGEHPLEGRLCLACYRLRVDLPPIPGTRRWGWLMCGITSGEFVAAGWGRGADGGLSLLEGVTVRDLRGRSTPVQERWDTIGDGSPRSLGASRQLCWELAEV